MHDVTLHCNMNYVHSKDALKQLKGFPQKGHISLFGKNFDFFRRPFFKISAKMQYTPFVWSPLISVTVLNIWHGFRNRSQKKVEKVVSGIDKCAWVYNHEIANPKFCVCLMQLTTTSMLYFFFWTEVKLPSLGIDFKIKTIELQGKKIKLQIWYVCSSLESNVEYCDSTYCYILKSLSFYSSISITQALGSDHDSNLASWYIMNLQLSLS